MPEKKKHSSMQALQRRPYSQQYGNLIRSTPFLCICCFLFSFIIYSPTINFGYSNFDDDLIIKNHSEFFSNPANWKQAFTSDAFTDHSSRFYRPLQTLSYLSDIQISGSGKAWMHHTTNVLIFSLITALLFLMLVEFNVSKRYALFGSILFAAHPLFVFSVAWIPARGDLLLMFFSLVSFLFLIEFLKKRKTIHFALHWLCFSIALFCKETAAMLPVIFVTYYLIFVKKESYRKKDLLLVLLYLGSLVFWFTMRSKAIGDSQLLSELTGIASINKEFGLVPLFQNLRVIPEALINFIAPVHTQIVPSFSVVKTLAGSIIFILIIVALLKNKQRSMREKLFGLVWFVLLMLPTLVYKHNMLDYLHHRLLLPMAGILLFILMIIPAKTTVSTSRKLSLIWFIVVAALSTITLITSQSYKNPEKFYNTAIKQNPLFAIGYYNRGIMLNEKGLYDQAVSDYSMAVGIEPSYASAFYNRGVAYGNLAMNDKAIDDYNKAILLQPDNPQAYSNRGVIYCNRGNYIQAISDFSESIALVPDFYIAYNNRGYAYLSNGEPDKALPDLTKAIALRPDFAEAYNNRANAYIAKQMTTEACSDFEKAAELGSAAASKSLIQYCK